MKERRISSLGVLSSTGVELLKALRTVCLGRPLQRACSRVNSCFSFRLESLGQPAFNVQYSSGSAAAVEQFINQGFVFADLPQSGILFVPLLQVFL